MMRQSIVSLFLHLTLAVGQLTSSSLETHVDSCALSSSFNPIKKAYWTDLPHHRRTPFAVSPNGKSAYLAYLDKSETDVHVQQVDPSTFAAVGTAVTVTGGKEAGGLVAHDDGFALLTNEVMPSGTSGAPADSTPVAVLYRYTDGKQTFKTWLGGPDINDSAGSLASPDINGDLVFSAEAGYYAAYIVVTAYTGDAAGHFGDAVRYVTTDGTLETIQGASSSWGCSHNTGIALEAADAPPYASICSEDQGAVWLNTKGQGMTTAGVKISNENVQNGASNEPMGGMSGSYSNLARFPGGDGYVFAWVSRGATELLANEWMGDGYTTAKNRTNNRNVAVALFSDKNTLVGEEASSKVGDTDGDAQINWVTQGSNDCSNAHAAALDGSRALLTWEEASDPICRNIAMGCSGTFAGTKFQMVDSDGFKVGDVLSVDDTYVAGDMVTMSDGRVCWPYVSMIWKLDGVQPDTSTTKMSFACINTAGTASGGSSNSSSAASPAASSSAAAEAVVASPTAAAPQATSTADAEAALPTVPAGIEVPATGDAPTRTSLSSSASSHAVAIPSTDPALTSAGPSAIPAAGSGSSAAGGASRTRTRTRSRTRKHSCRSTREPRASQATRTAAAPTTLSTAFVGA